MIAYEIVEGCPCSVCLVKIVCSKMCFPFEEWLQELEEEEGYYGSNSNSLLAFDEEV